MKIDATADCLFESSNPLGFHRESELSEVEPSDRHAELNSFARLKCKQTERCPSSP